MRDEDTPGHGGRVLRDARQAARAAKPVRVVCGYTRRRLWTLTELPGEALWLDVGLQNLRAVRDGGFSFPCDRCGTRHRVRLDRLADAYAAAIQGDRVVRLPLAG